MEVTEARVRLVGTGGPEKLLAFASVTFDNSFVVRELRVIAGEKGPFVSMASRKLTDRCPDCGCNNNLRARFCNDCGKELPPDRAKTDGRGRARLHVDIAHPITSQCREKIQSAVLRVYWREKKAQESGYRPQPLTPEEGSEGAEDVPLDEEPPEA